ncbi:MAG: site-specific integrase, partial [Verrucomicrobiota bacterium]|nr:site-specific integrase [Verrucomicrobiota bacterium]
MPELSETRETPSDWAEQFFRFLSDEKDASVYTQRNYRQALGEFAQWHRDGHEPPVRWGELERNDFRLFLRQLGRRELSQAAIRLRFSALNSFYKFLMRRGLVESSPVKGVSLPKPAKRLPQFLTLEQMNTLLDAPMREFEAERDTKKGTKKKVSPVPYLRDRAILETIYSCGLRIGEICRMLAGEIEPDELVVNVHGKGKKERQVPIGRAAVEAI